MTEVNTRLAIMGAMAQAFGKLPISARDLTLAPPPAPVDATKAAAEMLDKRLQGLNRKERRRQLAKMRLRKCD